jgi:hypothetical protein
MGTSEGFSVFMLEEAIEQTMMDGLQIYYNFLRPHMALDGKTPAQKAKLVSDMEKVNWASLIKKATKTIPRKSQ